MINSNLEIGRTEIPHKIVDKLCGYRISGEEMQIVWTIIRKTYGWHKSEDAISMSQFQSKTGLKRSNVSRAISKLLSKKIIGVIKKDNSINIYFINNNLDEWKVLSKKITLSKKIIGVIKKDNGVLSKKIHTKDTLTKDTTQRIILCPQPESEDETSGSFLPEKVNSKSIVVPYQEIVKLYHEICADLPTVKILSETRKRQIKQRWLDKQAVMKKFNDETQSVDEYKFNDLRAWKRFFEKIAASDFLMGKVTSKNGRVFQADLEWVTKSANFIKIIENKYA